MNTGWKQVFATHEEPQQLSHGPWLGDAFPGVALPSRNAYGRWIIVRAGDVWTCAMVADVGPFCEDDDLYVFGSAIPRAEQYKHKHCPVTLADPARMATLPTGEEVELSNGAGIDLFPAVAKALYISTNTNLDVEWRFVEP